jgi:glycosyltransferase involved in cell wall biosynthesis
MSVFSRSNPKISVIIPAFNEEESIGLVIESLPQKKIKEIIVVNNDSTDKTAYVAREHGARVVDESYRGYGAACLKGISVLDNPEIPLRQAAP